MPLQARAVRQQIDAGGWPKHSFSVFKFLDYRQHTNALNPPYGES
jgi:hypothetical protein